MTKILSSKYKDLLLNYSNYCPIGCRHCLFGEKMDNLKQMSFAEIKYCLDSAFELGTIQSVALGSGEPFFDFELLVKASKYVFDKYKWPITFTTSCAWATSIKIAEAKLNILKELGLDVFLISVDDFHQEKVPLERVRNCIVAAYNLGIPCEIQCTYTKNSKKSSDYRKLLNLGDADTIVKDWADTPCASVGRAALYVDKDDFDLSTNLSRGGCSSLEIISILPDGSIQPCCGVSLTCAGLTVGNVFEERLVDIIRKLECNPIFNSLVVNNGPTHLANIVRQTDLAYFLKDKYTSACDACNHILSNPSIRSVLEEKLSDIKIPLLVNRLVIEDICKNGVEAH